MKHAVFLRGNVRVWNYSKQNVINFFNKFLNNPDWYVSVWDSTSTSNEKLSKDFEYSNLKYLNIVNSQEYYEKFNGKISTIYGSCKFNKGVPNYWRLAYLDSLMTVEKIKYEIENKFEYKSVTFIRPDILYFLSNNDLQYIHELKRMEVLGFQIPILSQAEEEGKSFSDFNFTAGSIASDTVGMRFLDTNFTEGYNNLISWDAHHLTSLILTGNHCNFIPDKYAIHGLILRPNMLEDESLWKIDLNTHTNHEDWAQKVKQLYKFWDTMNLQDKNYYFKKFNINPKDY